MESGMDGRTARTAHPHSFGLENNSRRRKLRFDDTAAGLVLNKLLHCTSGKK